MSFSVNNPFRTSHITVIAKQQDKNEDSEAQKKSKRHEILFRLKCKTK